MRQTLTIAYLAEGKLYLKRPDTASELVDSPFVQGILDRIERRRERHEWKDGGLWQFGLGRGRAGGLPGMQGMPALAETRRIRFTGVTGGEESGELLYTLDTDHVGGLFSMNLDQKHERRLFHRQQFRAHDVARHPKRNTLAVSLQAGDGTAHVAIMSHDQPGFREVSEGDCVDESPSWVAGSEKTLVFHSAGVARNPAGFVSTLGPYAIQQMDLDKGQIATLVEDDQYDFLLPRVTGDGSLFFIRRPYQAGATVSPWKVALDILLFPYRLIVAIIHFLNFFSLMFSRKPLITAGGPPKEGPDARYLMLWGKMIDAEKALRKHKNNDKGLVPSSWQLMCRAKNGDERVLARGVLAYDVTDDATVVYSDGAGIFQLDEQGKPTELCRGRMVERVSVIGA